MQGNFWLEKWQKGETGFHQEDFNPWLLKYWDALKLPAASTVFVPLCGKTRDMIWLKDDGHKVVGVELSDLAAKDFFTENNLSAKVEQQKNFVLRTADNILLLCGDFFALTAEDMKGIGGVYDRAALIALPPEMRVKYAQHMADILPKGAKMLMLTIDYDQSEMQGPPFSVTAEEVEKLYGQNFTVRKLERSELLSEDRLKKRGLSRLHDNVLVLERK